MGGGLDNLATSWEKQVKHIPSAGSPAAAALRGRPSALPAAHQILHLKGGRGTRGALRERVGGAWLGTFSAPYSPAARRVPLLEGHMARQMLGWPSLRLPAAAFSNGNDRRCLA